MHDTPPPYGTVIFDCDSTLSRIEGIEELARECRGEVEALTRRAMDGELPLEAAYGARLDLIQPARVALEEVAQLYITEALPHAKELVAALLSLGKRVAVVSGGLRAAVAPFAHWLGIEDSMVHAVGITFDDEGQYAGFDVDSPLARSGGKIPVVRSIVKTPGAAASVLIGDGSTDLEAAAEVQRFIGYGGVVARAQVMEQSEVSCTVADLAALVPLLLSPDECARLQSSGQYTPLLEAAASHI
jgi:phosphoserine phosphatase